MATMISVLHTRVEIVSLEYEEEREWLRISLLRGFVTLFLLAMGVLMLLAFFVLMMPEEQRTAATGVLGLVLLIAGIAVGGHHRRQARLRPRMLDSTLTELAKDRDQLFGRR